MLRRKLLMLLALLVGLLLTVAVAAIFVLQGVLSDMNHTGVEDRGVVDVANSMASTITQAEIELREIQLGKNRHLDNLLDQMDLLRVQTDRLGKEYGRPLPQAKASYESIVASMATFEQHVGMLATVEDERLAQLHMDPAITASISLRQEILNIGRMMRDHTAREEQATLMWFRRVVLGLTIVFLVVLNISVMVLLRMSNLVLKPVRAASKEQGMEAYREVAKRHKKSFRKLSQ